MVTLWGVMDANEGLTVYFDCKDFSQLLFLFKTFATLPELLLAGPMSRSTSSFTSLSTSISLTTSKRESIKKLDVGCGTP